MNTLLQEAIDALINNDDEQSNDFLKQALLKKMQAKLQIDESDDDSIDE